MEALAQPDEQTVFSTHASSARPWRSLGIDVGLTGAVAALDSDGRLEVHPLPAVETRGRKAKGRRTLDPMALVRLLEHLHAPALLDGAQVFATLENVHAMPKQGVSSVFSFGRSLGAVETALAAARVPYTPVEPAEWKLAMRVPAAKDAACRRADQLFPDSAHLWRGSRGGLLDGNAEAALIAAYGARRA